MPILDNEGEVVGVAQIVNKMSSDQTSFSASDEEVTANSTTESLKISCNFRKICPYWFIGI